MPHTRIFRNQRGSSAMLIFGGLIILVGSAVFLMQYNKSTQYQLSQAIAKMEIDAALMGVHGGLRAALNNYPDGSCLPSMLDRTRLSSYRRFNEEASLIQFDLNEAQLKTQPMGCLLPKELLERVQSVAVKISPLQEDLSGMLRKVEVVVEVITKAKDAKFSRRAKLARVYQFQPLSVSRFGLMFQNSLTGGSFVELAGEQTKLRVIANVLYAGQTSPGWPQLLSSTPERMMFDRNAFARFNSVGTVGLQNMAAFRLTFRNGLQTGALRDAFVEKYLPTSSPAWNQRFDYFPQYNSSAYPTPERVGSPTVSYCGSGGEPFDGARAAISEVPDAEKGPDRASQTCQSGANHMAFVFLGANRNLKIRLKADDRNFCGLVVADELTVEIDSADPLVYGLIGNFFVNKLRIVNVRPLSAGYSEVRIYNPNDGIPFEGLAPIDQSAAELANHFRQLASSTGRNFYVPIARGGSFAPWSANEYLRECPEASGTYSYNTEYKAFNQLEEYKTYQRDEVGSLYALEVF